MILYYGIVTFGVSRYGKPTLNKAPVITIHNAFGVYIVSRIYLVVRYGEKGGVRSILVSSLYYEICNGVTPRILVYDLIAMFVKQ